MSARFFLLAVTVMLAFPATSLGLVTAEIDSTKTLVINGTSLRDNIRVRVEGSSLRVSDTGRVNGRNGCSQAGSEASCSIAAVDDIEVFSHASDDIVTIFPAVPVPARINGGLGDDTLQAGNGGDGSRLEGEQDDDVLKGGTRDDVLTGGPGNDRYEGGPGDDSLDDSEGADEYFGGEGDGDVLEYSTTSPVIATIGGPASGNAGAAAGDLIVGTTDVLRGGSGADVLTGSGGDNVLEGGGGNDTLDGRGGPDVLRPDVGVDVVLGGEGRDTVSYLGIAIDHAFVPVLVQLGGQGPSGPQQDRNAGGDTIQDVEDAEGTILADTLIGSSAANRLVGGLGNDSLSGGTGPDPDGPDQFEGGEGADSVSYPGRAAAISADADAAFDDGAPGEQDNIGVDVESITGGDGPDNLAATGLGDSFISVNFGGVLTVPVKAVLRGGPGNDQLVGHPGNDQLVGGPGLDTMTAGAGTDVVDATGDALAETANCGPGTGDVGALDLVDTQTGCENVFTAAVARHPTATISGRRPVLAGRVLRVVVACPRAAAGACRGRLDVALAAGGALGTVRFDVARGARRALRVRLGAGSVARLRRAGRVRLTTREQDPEGRPKTSTGVRRVRR